MDTSQRAPTNYYPDYQSKDRSGPSARALSFSSNGYDRRESSEEAEEQDRVENHPGSGSAHQAGKQKKGAATGSRKPTCDICRKRKIKCVRPETASPRAPPLQCNGCKSLGLECTYLHVYKRPGRPNTWLAGVKSKNSNTEIEEHVIPHPRRAGPSDGNTERRYSQSSMTDRPYQPNFSQSDMPHNQHHSALKASEVHGNAFATISGDGLPPFQMASPDYWNSSSASPGRGSGVFYNRAPPANFSEPFMNDGYGQSDSSSHQRNVSFDIAPGPSSFSQPGPSSMRHSNSTTLPDGRPIPAAILRNASSNPIHVQTGVSPDSENSARGMKTGSDGNVYLSPLHQQFGLHGTASSSSHNTMVPSDNSGMAKTTNEYIQNQARKNYERNHSRSMIPSSKLLHDSLHPLPQIEDITSWATVSFFISLYLRHLHALTPIVHKPDFTVCLATRLDQKDVEFRAFLLSMTSFVISQSPKSRMIEHYNQAELEKLQNSCYRASQLLQSRRYKEPNLVQVGTLLCDYFFCASTGKIPRASATMAEAVSLIYRMNMHDDARSAASGIDHTEIQLRRRAFWHLYAIDKTEASAGNASLMNDYEGLCSLPLEVDDDFITAQGSFPQPPNRTSTMVGFVACSKLFKIMSEVLFRHRYAQHRFSKTSQWETDPLPGELSSTDNDAQAMDELAAKESAWITRAHDRIREVLDRLPPDLATQRTEATSDPSLSPDLSAIFGMQVANCLITAASVQFALYDYKAFLDAGADTVAECQEQTAREMYRLLSSIPLDHLAANGESMRGKVLRIILALLNRSRTPDQLSEEVKSFWDMFSMIQFVQVMPSTADSVFPSREPSLGPPVDA